MKQPYDCEYAFEDYMRKTRSGVAQHSIQFKESRRTWVAAQRRFFIWMRDELTLLADDKAEAELQRIDKEMREFWSRACEDRD